MRKFLIFTALIWGIALACVCFYRPSVEAYGQTLLQFDDNNKSYFIKTGNFYEPVEKLSDNVPLSVGLPVSYFKTSYSEMVVVSGNISEEAFCKEALADVRMGFCIGALAIWIFFIIVSVTSRDVTETVPVASAD